MKNRIINLLAGCILFGIVACNNSSNTTSSNDSTAKDSSGSSTVNTSTSTGNYAARTDSVNANVSAGNYINPKTGKAYTKINVDPGTGALTDENGAPIRRFVDRRTWWVYDANNWDTVGAAKMHGSSLTFRDPKGNWETYEKVWVDDMNNSTGTSTSDSSMNNSNNSNSKNPKVKVSDNGNKIKIKKDKE